MTANRSRSELEGVVGFFVNTLVSRARLTDNPTFEQLLARVRQSSLDALAHQDLPFERLVEELAPARDLSRNPLFQVLFEVLNAPHELDTPTFSGLSMQDLHPPTRFSVFDLAVEAEERDDGLYLGFSDATDLFDRATIERMAGHYQCLLAAAVSDPATRLSQLPVLTSHEQQQLAAWNDTSRPLPTTTVIDAFLHHAAQTPHAPAVIDQHDTHTYQDIAEHSERIARHLCTSAPDPNTSSRCTCPAAPP